MSSFKEHSVMLPKDPIMETPKTPQRSYTREFLLSLSERQVCKKLPHGFDKSLLSEFEDASPGFQDGQRVKGSSLLQGFRRTDYGSSAPARGDSDGYSRELHGWDSRSSGRSDTDSDSGSRYGSLARRSGQYPEHDGLLGSGSFPRAPGYAAGVSAHRFRPTSNVNLNRSNEPYQPPRTFKAVPHSRRAAKDSYNDETFGSTDSTSDNKVEEEKKRRAEFELMRKEQQKALQDKQKVNSNKLEDSLSDITGPLEIPTDGKISSDSDKVLKQSQLDDCGKSVSLQTPQSRPIVPPGFLNNPADKSSTFKTLLHVDPLKDHDAKTDDIGSPNTSQSKFASWFLEEDKKALVDISEEKPTDLLSLIVGSDKGGSDVSDVTALGQIFPFESMVGLMTPKSATASSTGGLSELIPIRNAPEQMPAMLTCEDLEQSILSEMGGNSSLLPTAEQEMHAVDEKAASPGTSVDNQASQHLLFLLQKEMGSKNVVSTSVVGKGYPDKPCDQQVGRTYEIDGNINGIAEALNSSGKSLTLEALFGPAFMNELHSAQRNFDGSARADITELSGLPFPTSDDGLFLSKMNEIGNGMNSHDGSVFMSNDGITKLDNVRHLVVVHDHGKELEFSRPLAEVDSVFGGFNGGLEVRIPKENFIILSDPINARNPISFQDSSSSRGDLLHSSNASVNLLEKLTALGADLEDERSMIGGLDPLFLHGPYETFKPELPYRDLHPQATHFHAPQINHGKSLFDPLRPPIAHLDPHMKFVPPNNSINHQFPVNVGHPSLPHQSAGLQGFDRPIPPPILQQMHMAGNLPPPHLVGGFPGGAPMPPRSSHNSVGYLQEHNPTRGFPFGQQQPNYGGRGMPPPGSDFGSGYNPPEALERLLSMEIHGNPKRSHPFAAAAGNTRPIYGHEVDLDMGFRYR